MSDEFPQPIKKIGDVIRMQPQGKRKRGSERGALVGWFLDNLNRTSGGRQWKASYIGFRLAHLSLSDLYYLKSVLSDQMSRGYPFGKAFFGSLKVRPPKE